MKHYIRVTSGPYKGAIYEFATKKDALVLAKALEKGRPHSTDYGNDRDGFPEVHLSPARQFDTPVDPGGPFSIYVRHRGESAWKNVLGPFATRKAAEKHSKDFRARGKEVAVMPTSQHAHATVKTEASSTTELPLKEKLQLAAKWIRRELKKRDDGSHPSHLAAKLLEEADAKFKLGSYGVEGWAKSPSRGYQYLNYGDSYDPTIVIRSNPTQAAVFVALGGWASYA